MVEYEYSRLCFKADIIEPLNENDSFVVHTPDGTFMFTKADFYRVFANVIKTKAIKRVDYIVINIHPNEQNHF